MREPAAALVRHIMPKTVAGAHVPDALSTVTQASKNVGIPTKAGCSSVQHFREWYNFGMAVLPRQMLPAACLLALSSAASWLGMMVVHESGHMLHAWFSGGRVARVVLHPLAFSRTDFSENPHPLFVAWGGVLWGCVLPLTLAAVGRACRFRFAFLLRFFAGFCFVANGAYLATSVLIPVGDSEDLLRLGVPLWTLVCSGTVMAAGGFAMWNRIGIEFGFGDQPVTRPAIVFALGCSVLLAAGMLGWSALPSWS